MSEPSQEPGRIRRMTNSVSRWRNTRRGTKTLKAAYAQAARDAKRMDPVVRERIGRANLTKADLQMLAENQVAAQFGGQQYRDLSQTLSQAAADRVPNGRTNRFSRWRATRRGTKALKAAYAQAAKDVKKMDPAVRESIGRHRITRSDLQALSQGRMEEVFRPEGRLGASPPGAQQPQVQQPAQQEPLADQIRAAQLQLQATMLQNQQFQLQLESIQLQLIQAQQQAQQQVQALQQQLREAQAPVQPEAQTPTGPEAQALVQPDAQTPTGPEAQAPAQPEVQQPDHVGQHAVVPDGQAPAQPDVQTPGPVQPQTDQRAAWVASGTGQGTQQPAPQPPGRGGPQAGPEQPAPGTQQPDPRAPATQQPAAQAPGTQQPDAQAPGTREPAQQPAARAAAERAAMASNEQWTPSPSSGPDQSAQSQADQKAKLSKEFDAAFTGQAPPRISTDGQGRPAGERPAGSEPHRQTGPAATRNPNAPER